VGAKSESISQQRSQQRPEVLYVTCRFGIDVVSFVGPIGHAEDSPELKSVIGTQY
jgi:hypothetical protein